MGPPPFGLKAEAATLSRRSLLSATEQRAIEHLQAGWTMGWTMGSSEILGKKRGKTAKSTDEIYLMIIIPVEVFEIAIWDV